MKTTTIPTTKYAALWAQFVERRSRKKGAYVPRSDVERSRLTFVNGYSVEPYWRRKPSRR